MHNRWSVLTWAWQRWRWWCHIQAEYSAIISIWWDALMSRLDQEKCWFKFPTNAFAVCTFCLLSCKLCCYVVEPMALGSCITGHGFVWVTGRGHCQWPVARSGNHALDGDPGPQQEGAVLSWHSASPLLSIWTFKSGWPAAILPFVKSLSKFIYSLVNAFGGGIYAQSSVHSRQFIAECGNRKRPIYSAGSGLLYSLPLSGYHVWCTRKHAQPVAIGNASVRSEPGAAAASAVTALSRCRDHAPLAGKSIKDETRDASAFLGDI